MQKYQTISWIFFSFIQAAKNGRAHVESIRATADWLNHAVPDEEELKVSFDWLVNMGWVIQSGTEYVLTEEGAKDVSTWYHPKHSIRKNWKNLEEHLKTLCS